MFDRCWNKFVYCLAAVGIWGMVAYKTGRLQKSIDDDISDYSPVKYNNLTADLKKKADYLNEVCDF